MITPDPKPVSGSVGRPTLHAPINMAAGNLALATRRRPGANRLNHCLSGGVNDDAGPDRSRPIKLVIHNVMKMGLMGQGW